MARKLYLSMVAEGRERARVVHSYSYSSPCFLYACSGQVDSCGLEYLVPYFHAEGLISCEGHERRLKGPLIVLIVHKSQPGGTPAGCGIAGRATIQ